MSVWSKVFPSYSDREIRRIVPIVDKIEAMEPDMERLTNGELRAKTAEFQRRYQEGETLDELLPEAFAVVREAARRVPIADENVEDAPFDPDHRPDYSKQADVPKEFRRDNPYGQRPFRVQLIGGVVLHQGRIAEMRTGEGKTLVCAMPAYLNALTGEGVHVVTVNDYLAQLHATLMGRIHEFLGLKVGCILHDLDNDERRAAYNCDITYATNNELGFDYLRDNMVVYEHDAVQRGLTFAVIDEVDSILIDEARTPLIISGSSGKSTHLYKVADSFVRGLKKGAILNEDEAMNPLLRADVQEEGDYIVDEKQKTVTLTQDGVRKAERFFAIDNLSDPDNMEILHHVNNALKANFNMHLDQNYVVKDGEIVIVDEFTGRMMPGRRYSDGLHQAIEAKENVDVQRESKTLATITFQNYFNKYGKKSGMTGTALTEENEFREIYGMDVVVVPTNKPVARVDETDTVYKSEAAKFRAVVNDVSACYAKGQPVLIGTITIEKSELLSDMLKKTGIKHQVLNAKYHAQEAEIVALAGQKDAITIATNMAGRGTDIKLGEGVPALGGLRIVGTERHESRRIDNQLRGRSGRQGDPGQSKFYISLEDDLMRLFGSDRIKRVVETLGLEEDDPIEHNLLAKAIENAQKKVEGNNFSTRKHLLDYDRVMNEQREIIYGERKKVLEGQDLKETILNMTKQVISRNVEAYTGHTDDRMEWDLKGLNEQLVTTVHSRFISKETADAEDLDREKLSEGLYAAAEKLYNDREREFTAERMREIERHVMLRVVDSKWMDHIDDMEQMRQGIMLHAYAQRDPLTEYKFVSYDMFEELSKNIQTDTVRAMYNVRIAVQPEKREQVAQPLATNKDESASRGPIKRKTAKVGRNDTCPCGSGKKYKQCCGRGE